MERGRAQPSRMCPSEAAARYPFASPKVKGVRWRQPAVTGASGVGGEGPPPLLRALPPHVGRRGDASCPMNGPGTTRLHAGQDGGRGSAARAGPGPRPPPAGRASAGATRAQGGSLGTEKGARPLPAGPCIGSHAVSSHASISPADPAWPPKETLKCSLR